MKVLIAGDFCDRYRVTEKIKEGNYASLFGEVKPIVESADVSIVNFEFPVVLNEGTPIPKCGPNLRGQKESVDAIKYAGFNVCTLANNHILDQGEQCCLDTKRLIEEVGMKTVGAGKNLAEASEILYVDKDGEKLAIINCCEHEFSIATEISAGANPLNPIQQFYKIQEAKTTADYVLVIVHGGHEHYQLPSPRMKETFCFFIDAGADAVVNHHQHCYSGYEVYKEKPIFYGLGNFCFDNPSYRKSIWNESIILWLDLCNSTVDFNIVPIKQCSDEEVVSLLPSNAYNKRLEELNSIINDWHLLNIALQEYYSSCDLKYEDIFEPIQNRFFLGAKRRGWLKSIIGEKKRLLLENFILCESHREKIAHMFNNSHV